MDTPSRWRRDMVHMTTKRDPERIYLEPWPYSPEGRLWSEHNVWPLYTWPPEPEGESERASGVEYIRSDLHAAEIARLTRELSAALERERRLREALLTLLTAVDRACGTVIPQGSFAAARQAARDAIRAAEMGRQDEIAL